ncbi:hypothetical protein J3F84DRAFT_57023 [Trichoderma pleuroticola]
MLPIVKRTRAEAASNVIGVDNSSKNHLDGGLLCRVCCVLTKPQITFFDTCLYKARSTRPQPQVYLAGTLGALLSFGDAPPTLYQEPACLCGAHTQRTGSVFLPLGSPVFARRRGLGQLTLPEPIRRPQPDKELPPLAPRASCSVHALKQRTSHGFARIWHRPQSFAAGREGLGASIAENGGRQQVNNNATRARRSLLASSSFLFCFFHSVIYSFRLLSSAKYTGID